METGINIQRSSKRGCTAGRLVNLIIAFFFFLILITAVIAIGLLGIMNLSLAEYPDFSHNPQCPLYMVRNCREISGKTACFMEYGSVSVCYFVEASFGIVGLISLIYIVVYVIRAIRQYDIWLSVIVDLVIVCALGVGCFATAITLSIGLAITCDKLAEEYPGHSCDVHIPYSGQFGKYFYSSVFNSQVSAWVCMLFIFILLPIIILRLVMYIKRRRQRTAMDDGDDLLSNPIDDKANDIQ